MDATILAVLVKESLIMGLLYSVLALGFNLVYRVSKSINLAQPELVLVVSYAALVASMNGLNFALVVLVASAIGLLIGVILEYTIARPLLGKPAVSLIAATIGVFYLLRGVTVEAVGDYWSGGSISLPHISYRVGGIIFTSSDIAATLLATASLALVIIVHRFTGLGVAMRAVAENPYAAAGYGLPLRKLTALSWGFAGIITALGGIALSLKTSVVPTIDSYVLKALTASLLAGLDTVEGVVVGGLVLSFVENFSNYMLHDYLPGFGEAAAFIVMLLVLLLKPYGFFGTERVERV